MFREWLVVWEYNPDYTVTNMAYDQNRRVSPKNPKTWELCVDIGGGEYAYPKWAMKWSIWIKEYADKFKISLDFNWSLRQDQADIVNALWVAWMIDAATARGKSRAIAGIIKKHSTRTLVIAPSVAILKSLMAKFDVIFGKGKTAVFNAKKDNDSDIIIIVGKSFNKYRETLSGKFWQLIIDEAHKNLIWEQRRKALCLFRVWYFFWLTGTPESQSMSPDVFWLIYGKCSKAGAEVGECQIYTFKHYESNLRMDEGSPDITTQLDGRSDRIRKMVSMIKKVMVKRNMGIVFCDRIDLVEKLVAGCMASGVYAEAYTGATKNKEDVLKRIESRNGVMVVTRSSCGEWFDHPPLDAGFFYCGIKFSATTRQIVGRILREHPGKALPVLVDWQDSILKLQYRTRLATYARIYKTPVIALPHDFIS